MMISVLQALYFMLPAYFANMAPVFTARLSGTPTPIDFGRYWKGKRIFGDHKTYRGFFTGATGGVVAVVLQKFAAESTSAISLISYGTISWKGAIFLGMAFGGGALLGDLIKSFFKRRLGKSSGEAWVPFDQLDFVIGALGAVSFWYSPPLPHILIILTITPLLHVATNTAAYRLGLKKVWW